MLDQGSGSEQSGSIDSMPSEEYYDEVIQDERSLKEYLHLQKERMKQMEENGHLLEFKRPKQNACVNKLPKVGQLVNLNSYEVYIAVKKIQKPVIRIENS